MYRFSVTARCACPFFIEIIEIIEIWGTYGVVTGNPNN